MQRQEQLRVLKEIINHLDKGTTVDAGGIRHNPTWVYTCPELAEKEWQSFYRDYPQVIGASSDLPEPGTFMTTNDFGTPVLATRDAKGTLRAFVNVCRHRGVVLEPEASGTRSKFICPFHAWTYTNEGKLAGIPKPAHFGKIDPDCHGLVPLPAVERFGLLWVHPKPEGSIDLDQVLGGLVREFQAWGWESLVNLGYDSYEVRLNWKLAMDTFGETYHFTSLHRNSLALSFHGNVQAYDTYGRNHRMTLVRREIDEMRKRPEETWQISQGTFPVYYLFPNIQINVAPFGLILVRTYPKPGDPAHNGFGRNEPAPHHYHNTYREALGMEPLELLEA